MKKTCAVVGAGIVGRLLAWRLAYDGHNVALFSDKSLDVKEGCSQAAAGMLAPFCELDHSEIEICSAGVFGIAFWRQLQRLFGADLGFQHKGSQVVAAVEDQLQLKHLFDTLNRKLSFWQAQKLPVSELFATNYLKLYQDIISNEASEGRSFQFIKWLNKNDIEEAEVKLSQRFPQSFFCRFEAQVDAQKVLATLRERLSQLKNVTLRSPEEVQAVQARKVFLKDNSAEEYDFVFDCRGFLKSQENESELKQGLRPVRGESAIILCKEVELTRPVRMLHPRYPIYVVPRSNQTFFVGATQIETGFSGKMTVRSSLELLSALYCLDPAFGEAEILEFRTGLRPAYEDNLPRLLWEEGRVILNGFYRHGYLLAPYYVDQISMMLAGEAGELNKYEGKSAVLSQGGLIWK